MLVNSGQHVISQRLRALAAALPPDKLLTHCDRLGFNAIIGHNPLIRLDALALYPLFTQPEGVKPVSRWRYDRYQVALPIYA
jgi:hypothetical protein